MGLLNDITPQLLLLRLAAYLVFCSWHGFMLAGIARLLGDRTPQYAGRLSLSPWGHIAMSGLFMTALFQSGWITPMRFKPETMRGGRLGLVFCALASLAATLVLVGIINLLRPIYASSFGGTAGYTGALFMQQVQEVVIASVALNLLPIPMLTGAMFLLALFPQASRRLRKLEPIGMGCLVIALVAGWVPNVVPILAPWLMIGR